MGKILKQYLLDGPNIPTGKKENAQSSAKESTLEQRISDLEDMAAALYGGEA